MKAPRSRIFISSVQKELAAERQALKAFIEGDALLRRFFEVFLFEDVPASDRRADDVYCEVWNPGRLPSSLTFDALRRPHASVPHNPLIAEPLFLTRLVERAGSGILDMIALCAEAGLAAPEFRQDAGSFVQTLWRPRQQTAGPGTESRSESGSESGSEWWISQPGWEREWRTQSVHHRVMAALSISGPLSRSELAAAIGHKSITRALRQGLADLMDRRLVAYTLPDKPNSRLQHYTIVTSRSAKEPNACPPIGARQIICTFFRKREVFAASFMQRPGKGPGCSKE